MRPFVNTPTNFGLNLTIEAEFSLRTDFILQKYENVVPSEPTTASSDVTYPRGNNPHKVNASSSITTSIIIDAYRHHKYNQYREWDNASEIMEMDAFEDNQPKSKS